MNNKIKSAFDEIHADESLKQSTVEFISKKYSNQTYKHSISARKALVPLCAVFAVIFCIGIMSYNVPVAAISLDTDSSVELTINRYNRVIGVTGFDSNGKELLEIADVKHLDYNDAVNTIIENAEQKEEVIVTVNGRKSSDCEEIVDNINSCHGNVHCYKGNTTGKQEAENYNLSYGKYNAYLILKSYDSSVTVDDIRNLSAREIYALIEKFENNSTTESDSCPDVSCDTTCESTKGNGHGYGKNHSEHHN